MKNLLYFLILIPSLCFGMSKEYRDNENKKIIVDETARTLKAEKPHGTAFEVYSDIGAHKHVIYQLSDGSIKWDINFERQPLDNDIAFRIKNFQDYDFYYQPPLTQEEKEKGCIRPDDVVGSYAVYWKNGARRNNEWKSGKAGHIKSGYAIADNGDKVWCSLWYDDTKGILWVTIPQDFFETHTITKLDPTFGLSTKGATEDSSASGFHIHSWALLNDSNININNSYTWIRSTLPTSNYHYKIALYNHNGVDPTLSTGTPTSLVANSYTGAVVVSTNIAYISTVTITNCTLTNSGTYWITMTFDDASIRPYYDTVTNGTKGLAGTYATFPEDPAVSYTNRYSIRYTMWYDYTINSPAASSGYIPPILIFGD